MAALSRLGLVTAVAIHQPNYLPWLGYFSKSAHSDVLVLLDNVQFPRRSYVNRVQVKTARGVHWLTQPVLQHGRYDQRIRDVEFSEGDWASTHLATLQANYGRAPHFRSHFRN